MAVEARKQKEKQQRYNAILEAAEQLMIKNGIQNLSMDAIAKQTELAKGTLYLYFKSKEEILGALSIKSRHLLLTHFQKAAKKHTNPVEQIKAVCIAHFNFFKKYPFYFELISIYEANDNLVETVEIQRSINDIIQFVNGITISAKEKGLLNTKLNPIQFTFCLWGMVMGISQLIKVRGAAMEKHVGFTEKHIINTYLLQLELGMRK
jgi:TetR/AcrR family transcriptional regulator